MEKSPNNPKQRSQTLLSAPRCLAKTRRGTACQSPAVKGRRRCRMHGGTDPGAPRGNQNALKHGMKTARAIEERRQLRQLLRERRDFLGAIDW
ncbi:HGGxSTG domain-containing protein [Sphingomonas sp. J344]|uniref:HGGxSTG domain-containing protein n=1 Tax=Sphingomonas sp. J344 TaxID=2898434 RepID=UPI0035B30E13